MDNFTKTKKSYERLAEALEAAGVKKYGRGRKVAEITGYSEARVSEMLSGKIPLNEKFRTIVCSKFKFSEEYIESGEGEIFEKQESSSIPGMIPLREIPVLGRISAGFPDLASQEIIEYISIPGTPENTFALVVKGRSMWPTLYDGDYVLFIENGEYKSEDVLIVLDTWGDAMVKRLKIRDERKFLVSDNPEYPIIEPDENYRIIGKVVNVWRNIKF